MLTLLAAGVMVSACTAADWPQFRGPQRDGKSSETRLLKKWPQAGPKLIWSVDGLGAGYASAAIANGLVYTTGKHGLEGYILCFDLNGNLKWKLPYGPEWTRSYPATRTTPTVDNGRLYLFSGLGKVYCLDAQTGAEVWSRDVFSEFDGLFPTWGMSECLLVDGSKVIASPGGKKASVVALDKNTGDVQWACNESTEGSAYCNPLAIEHKGYRMIVTMLRDSVVGIDPETGKLLWRDPFDDYHSDRSRVVNANAPLYLDGCVYTTSGYDNGGAMVQLSADPTKIVRACLDWNTGKVMYDAEWQGNKGSTIYADDMLYCYAETTGDVGLAKATPDGFEVVSSFRITAGKGKHWAHPSISDGRLYIRHGDVMMVYDISAKD
jgi:outer membrane protein assembly factor BamB